MKRFYPFFLILLILSGIILYALFVRAAVPALLKEKNAARVGNTTRNTTTPTSSVSKGEVPDMALSLPNNFVIHTFASNLGNPRDLVYSPGGTLLVSIPRSNKVVALPDSDGDGVADTDKTVIDNLNHPHGLAFFNGKLFIASTTSVDRFSWDETSLTATKEKTLFSLPANNNHNNRTITFSKDGTMYVSVGSTCNVCRESSPLSATIMISNENGDNPRVYAKGLRNAPFMAFNPLSSDLWVTEMGRDNLGDEIPPDEINIVKEGKNYGWPVCYGDKIHDTDFDKNTYIQNPCNTTEPPMFAIPAHSAPLGLSFITSTQFPPDWQNDLLVSYHGSWNRSTKTGYKIVRLNVEGNTITGSEDFLTGFLDGNNASSRPVDMEFDKKGNLYVSDDKDGNVYIIQKQ